MALRKASRSSELFCDLTIWKGIVDRTSKFSAPEQNHRKHSVASKDRSKVVADDQSEYQSQVTVGRLGQKMASAPRS